MLEQTKASTRRFREGAFQTRYFVGNGIDIGGKPDPLFRLKPSFPLMRSCRTWDLEDGDAQRMEGVPDGAYDFVHASHCLQYMRDVDEALVHWIRILRPGGYLVVTVPDEDLYEHGLWPSPFHPDHRWSFTIHKPHSALPKSLNVLDLALRFSGELTLERLWQIRDFFDPALAPSVDQTQTPNAECAIEIIWRKRG